MKSIPLGHRPIAWMLGDYTTTTPITTILRTILFPRRLAWQLRNCHVEALYHHKEDGEDHQESKDHL